MGSPSETLFHPRAMERNVLERRDYRVIPGVKAADVWPRVWDWWQRAGFALYHVGPNQFIGSSTYSTIGLTREIGVRLHEAHTALYVAVAFRSWSTADGSARAETS